MPQEQVEAGELEVTDLPLDHPVPVSASFIQEVSIHTPSNEYGLLRYAIRNSPKGYDGVIKKESPLSE